MKLNNPQHTTDNFVHPSSLIPHPFSLPTATANCDLLILILNYTSAFELPKNIPIFDSPLILLTTSETFLELKMYLVNLSYIFSLYKKIDY